MVIQADILHIPPKRAISRVNRFFEIHSVVMMHPPQIIISHISWSLQLNLHFTAVHKASSYALRIVHDYCFSIPEMRRPGTMVNEISDWATRDNHSNLWQEWKREPTKSKRTGQNYGVNKRKSLLHVQWSLTHGSDWLPWNCHWLSAFLQVYTGQGENIDQHRVTITRINHDAS